MPSALSAQVRLPGGNNNKEITMHYKNGREAKNGDPIMVIPDPKYGGKPMTGILYDFGIDK